MVFIGYSVCHPLVDYRTLNSWYNEEKGYSGVKMDYSERLKAAKTAAEIHDIIAEFRRDKAKDPGFMSLCHSIIEDDNLDDGSIEHSLSEEWLTKWWLKNFHSEIEETIKDNDDFYIRARKISDLLNTYAQTFDFLLALLGADEKLRDAVIDLP
jgi:phosphoenolpyruvate-protein kinase (PTS system EI component)